MSITFHLKPILPEEGADEHVGDHVMAKAELKEILRLHRMVFKAFTYSLEKAIRVGELLEKVKETVPYGKWVEWQADNLPFSQQTASWYMRVWSHRDKLVGIKSLSEAYTMLEERNKQLGKGKKTPSPKVLGELPKDEQFGIILASLPLTDVDYEHTLKAAPISSDNSILAVQCSASYTDRGMHVMYEWGFEHYVTAFVEQSAERAIPFFNIRFHPLLIGKKGKLLEPKERTQQFFDKYDDVANWLEKAYPDQRRLELYCTSERPNWTCVFAAQS